MRWSSPDGSQMREDAFLTGLAEQAGLPVFRKHFAMGTVFEIVAFGTHPSHASDAMDHAFEEVDRQEQAMSLYRTTSELSRLNRTAHGQAQAVSADLYAVIEESLRYSELTEGAFDVTAGLLAERWKAVGRGEQPPGPAEEEILRCGVGYRQIELLPPDRIRFHASRVAVDLGAIGKGYAVDRAAAVLRSRGIESALINAGGSTLYAIGGAPGQSGWLVHLCDPSGHIDPQVLLRQNSVSTSQQTTPGVLGMPAYGHIIDVRAGGPLQSATAVSVVAPSATASDALSTALLLLGPSEGRDLVKKLTDAAAVWIAPQGPPESVTSGPEIRMRSTVQTSSRKT